MKNQYLTLFVALILSMTSCATNKEELSALRSENSKLQADLGTLQEENIDLKTSVDDQISEINALKDELATYREQATAANKPIAPRFDPKYRTLINNVNDGWEELTSGGGRSKLLANFLDRFSVNGVRFSGESGVEVGQGEGNFERLLDNVEAREGLDVSIGQINILFAEQVGKNYSVVYSQTVRVFEGGQSTERDILSVISGQDQDGLKVGNYSWVSLPHKNQ